MKNYGLDNFISFLLALLSYLCVVFVVFFGLMSEDRTAINYTDVKDSFIELAYPSKQILAQENAFKEFEEAPKQIDIEKLFKQGEDKIVKTEDMDQKTSDFNQLFGTFKEIYEEKATKIHPATKDSLEPLKVQASKLVKQLSDDLLEEKGFIEHTEFKKEGSYDEFLGKVTRIITQRWIQYHPNKEKISVRVQIFIDENGEFGYTLVQKSGNTLYDTKVAEFLESQKGKFIAYPPQNKHISIMMYLRDEVRVKNNEEK